MSAAINSVTYNGELEVVFYNGVKYVYENVPKNVAVGFIHAHSLGSYFNQNIKDRYFYRKVRTMKVDSSMINEVSYDNGNLTILFKTGGEYVYSGVPENIYNSFISAPSKGRYFLSNIKNRYNYVRK